MVKMKAYLKNVIFFVLISAVLILIGASALDTVTELELSKSTYTRTAFDFHICAPSKAQIEDIAANGDAESIFPYYAYKKAFSNDKIALLISDMPENASASVLTEGTLIEGAADKNGAMLDKTAADLLGVSVGDTISFNLLGQRYTKTVCAIYLPSTLAILEDGIVMVFDGGEMLKSNTPLAYGGAFIVANDKNTTGAYLNGYVGDGNVALSYDQYVSIYCGTKLPTESEDEFLAECQRKYSAYREEALASAKKSGGQVVDKLEAYSLIENKLLTREGKLKTLTTLAMIGAFAVTCAVLIIFTVSGAANDRIKRDNGASARRMISEYSILAAATGALVTVTVLSVLMIIASGGYFLKDSVPFILKLALPSLAAALPVIAACSIYVRRLYKSAAADTL